MVIPKLKLEFRPQNVQICYVPTKVYKQFSLFRIYLSIAIAMIEIEDMYAATHGRVFTTLKKYIFNGSGVLFNLHFWMISGNTFLQGDLIENWVKKRHFTGNDEIVHDVSFYSRVLHGIALCCMILHGTLANSRIVHLVIMLSNIHDWYWI